MGYDPSMDTVTCETCSAEIKGDNVGAHFEWHEALDHKLAEARERSMDEPPTTE